MTETAKLPKWSNAVSLVIPVYNEENAVADTLQRCREALEAWGGQYEIIIVDDGSKDETVVAIQQSEVKAKLLQHDINQGYGAALKTGFAQATHDWIAFVDADGSYPIEDFPRLLDELDNADMIVGERRDYSEQASWGRRIGKAILNPMANMLAGRKIPDLNSGMRIVRRSLLDRYWHLLPDGFSLTTTITMALLCSRRRVTYLPIEYHERTGASKIRPVRDMINFILLILRTATYFRPLKIYGPAGATLLCLSFLVVVFSKLIFGQVMDVTALFLMVLGAQLIVIGVVADLILKVIAGKPDNQH
jgi:glycosyltransferase involved in cell wall biosynthesis